LAEVEPDLARIKRWHPAFALFPSSRTHDPQVAIGRGMDYDFSGRRCSIPASLAHLARRSNHKSLSSKYMSWPLRLPVKCWHIVRTLRDMMHKDWEDNASA
jgi:hypothetical protein